MTDTQQIMHIDQNTDRKEIQRIAYKIGSGLAPMFFNSDYGHLCSELIHLEIIQILLQIVDRLSCKLDEIINDKVKVYNWIQGRAAVETLMYALPMFSPGNLKYAIDEYSVMSAGLDAMPEKITEDLYVFCLWAIWYGAKQSSKQQLMNNAATKVLQKCIKTYTHLGIIDRAWCACCAYVIVSDKVMSPTLEKFRKCQDDRSITAIKTKASPEIQTDRRGKAVSDIHDLRALMSK